MYKIDTNYKNSNKYKFAIIDNKLMVRYQCRNILSLNNDFSYRWLNYLEDNYTSISDKEYINDIKCELLTYDEAIDRYPEYFL